MAHPKPRRVPAPDVELPATVPFTGALADDAVYEGLDFSGLTLGPASATGASFLACRIERSGLEDVHLDRARFVDSRLAGLAAAAILAADTTWRATLVAELRVGAFLASGSTWDLVRLRGVKANLLDLRGARLSDVVLEDCAIGELDLGRAELRAVRVEGCSIDDLSVDGARLTDVDLVGARLTIVRGITGLRGATVSLTQLLDLAPQLAAGVGIRVRD